MSSSNCVIFSETLLFVTLVLGAASCKFVLSLRSVMFKTYFCC